MSHKEAVKKHPKLAPEVQEFDFYYSFLILERFEEQV
jgi:hypothetical protein